MRRNVRQMEIIIVEVMVVVAAMEEGMVAGVENLEAAVADLLAEELAGKIDILVSLGDFDIFARLSTSQLLSDYQLEVLQSDNILSSSFCQGSSESNQRYCDWN